MEPTKNYRQIYSELLRWDIIINGHFKINSDMYLLPLRNKGVLLQTEFEIVKQEQTNERKNMKLFCEIMPAKGESGLEALMDLFDNYHPGAQAYAPRKFQIHLELCWGNVPVRNQFFIGRQSLINFIETIFGKKYASSKDCSEVVVVSGPAGVGKTQIVTEYIHQNNNNYRSIFWISAAKLNTNIVELAMRFDLMQSTDAETILNVKRWFSHRSPCLIVYDGAENQDQIKSYVPISGCHILITSRYTDWSPTTVDKCISLDVFTKEESKLFVEKMLLRIVSHCPEDIDSLNNLLGHLPLALSLACAYLRECKQAIDEYVAKFQNVKDFGQKIGLNSKSEVEEVVRISVHITKFEIKQRSVFADKLLEVCTFLQCNSISKHLLLEALPKYFGHSFDFSTTMGILLNFDLLQYNEDHEEFSMNCNIRESIQFEIEVTEQRRLIEKVTKVLLSSCPSSSMHDDLIKKQRLVPHLKQLVNDVKLWNDQHKDSNIHAEVHLQLLETSADLHQELGLYNEVVSMLTEALLLIESKLNNDPVTMSRILINLSNAQGYLGNKRKQMEMLKEALPLQKNALGPDHPEVARTMTNLGNTYGALGNSAKHIQCLQRAWSIKKRHFGQDHIEMVKTMESLGNAYGFAGDYKKQVDLLEKSMLIQEEFHGSDHPDVGRTMVNLSNAYGELGETKKQCELLEKALVIQEEHFGPNHPEVAIILANLGNVYGYLGDPKRQKELVGRALIIQERHFGPEHPQLAKTLDSLGVACGTLGDARVEKMLLERAFVIIETHFGPNHPEIVRTMVNLSNAYGSLGDHKKRKELLERALGIQEKFFGAQHPVVAKTMGNLGSAYGALGDSRKEGELLERAFKIQTIHFGSDHPKVAASMANLSSAYVSFGDLNKAKYLLESALLIYENHFGATHPDIAIMLEKLATVVGMMGDKKKKAELLKSALKIKTTVFGPHHSNTLATMVALSEIESKCTIS